MWMYKNKKNVKTSKLNNGRESHTSMVFSKSYSKTPGLFAAFFVLLVLLSGCAQYVPPQNNGVFVPLKEIPRFNSYEEIFATMKASIGSRGYGYDMMENAGMPGVASSSDSTGKSVNYSRTNIQVEGVDEADIVKTDGKYIYNFSDRSLVITDAYPLGSAGIVSKTVLENMQPLEMFVQGDNLMVFARKSASYDGPRPLNDMMRYPYYDSQKTVVLLYNVSNRSAPVVVKELEFSGDYLSSRLIGDNAYFVVSARPYFYFDEPGIMSSVIVPKMSEDGVERFIALPQEIGYLPPMPPESFVTIASLNVNTKELQKETIVGSAENLFASQDNIYLAATSWYPGQVPVLEGGIRPDFERDEKTVINKFRLENGKIGFAGQGSVPGHVLNQFSMDEFEGKFRIATTTGSLWGEGASQSKNNLYVLDQEMNLVGSLEDLAPGEKIYSARFMGKRAYMVTFKKVDPLFVIDVSEPTNPRVLGKLKIPGYSDYLHPIDETHLIGVGKDTIEATDELVGNRGLDFAWYQGLKLAIFDVSNVENPIELHKIVIGDRGTDSYALDDHKAFLFDKEKELLVLPIELAEIPKEDKKPLEENQRSPAYGVPVFQGAFVFKVNLTEGFVERGRITHISGEEELKSGYYYPQESNVKRALFIENVLYTLSDKMLKANDLETLEEIKEFVFK